MVTGLVGIAFLVISVYQIVVAVLNIPWVTVYRGSKKAVLKPASMGAVFLFVSISLFMGW
jgi:hypothetical protein